MTSLRRDTFTARFGVSSRPPEQKLHEVPERVRTGCWNILSNSTDYFFENLLFEQLFAIPSIQRQYWRGNERLLTILRTCSWNSFFDVAEVAYTTISRRYSKLVPDFEYNFNELCAENGVQWMLKDGKIERRRPEEIATVIEESFRFLSQTGFEKPRSQLQKAVRALDQRPEPDVENCVKDAVGALEGTAKTLVGGPTAKLKLKTVLESEPFSSSIHGALKDALLKIEGYRGDAPGVGHAMVAGKPKTEVEDAEFVLTTCIAGIIFLMGKANKAKTP